MIDDASIIIFPTVNVFYKDNVVERLIFEGFNIL